MIESALTPPTRREANRHSRRETILDTAQGSFLEQGYDGTTMSGIAAQLGGSKGTLWSYFPSKEKLFAAVIGRVSESFRAQLLEILDPAGGDVEATLRRYVREFLNKVTSPPAVALHRLVVGEANRFPEMGQIFYDHAPRLTHQLLADYLAAAMDRGQLRRDDPLTAARNLSGLCMAGCHHRLMMGVIEEANAELIEEDVERVVPPFMRAYSHSNTA
jgi:TetR/AcrR family transcriptional repressor of mexJK operon